MDSANAPHPRHRSRASSLMNDHSFEFCCHALEQCRTSLRSPATGCPPAPQTGGRFDLIERRAVNSSGTFSPPDPYSA